MINIGYAVLIFFAATGSGAIRVDQVGYEDRAQKLAMVVVTPPAESISVYRLSDGQEKLTVPLSPPVVDPDSGDAVQIADFSSLSTPGRYELRLPNGARSAPFAITRDSTSDLLRLTMRSYYGQRCGTAVDLGGGYEHPACHPDEQFHASSGRTGKRRSTGGWHDAGDYGRYVVNSGISTGTLLWAWELFPEAVSDLDLQIPESDNDVPDFLDEIRWNLEWMLSMQDQDGGVWHKQTSEKFPPFIAPQRDATVSFIIGTGSTPYKSSCATADLAAVAAIAARIYQSYDTDLSQRSLGAAKRAWDWIARNPDVLFRNPSGVETGEYGDNDCRDERLWAAAELWRSSGDKGAHEYFLANSDEAFGAIVSTSPPASPEVGALAAWSYVLGKRGDAAVMERIRERSLKAADTIVERSLEHPYRIPMTRRDYVWGSNAVAANYALQLLVANEIRPERRYVDGARDVLHYLLGRNTFSLSLITGTGTNRVRNPHHRPSGSDRIAAPWPGLLVGGPNQHRQDPALRRLPEGIPPARMYLDDQESYASNEIAINWNAPVVFLLAGIHATSVELRIAGTVRSLDEKCSGCRPLDSLERFGPRHTIASGKLYARPQQK